MKSFTLAALAGSTYAAGAGNWGYNNLGKDWNSDVGPVGAQCATGKQQSPIDLSTRNSGAAYSVAASGFENTTGLETYIKGTKYDSYPHGAIYLQRDTHPDGELDMKHIKEDAECGALSMEEASQNKKCLHFNGDATITLNRAEGQNRTYGPAQIHMHAPSEHTIDGKYYELEAHMVMAPNGAVGKEAARFLADQQAQMGDANFQLHYAVLGVMFYSSDCTENGAAADCAKNLATTSSFFDAMKIKDIWASGRDWSTEEDYEVKNGKVPLQDFIYSLDMAEFFSYEGSLTTPPCAEGIRWTVLKKAMPIRPDLMALIKSKYAGDMTYGKGNGNNRAIQPINGRTVAYVNNRSTRSGTTGASSFGSPAASFDSATYGIWAVMGVNSFIQSIYFLQHYYYGFWALQSVDFAVHPDILKNGDHNNYTLQGLGEQFNVITMLVQHVPTAFVWMLTMTGVKEIIWFWVKWLGWMQYVTAFRMWLTHLIKLIGFWHDSVTDVNSYSGLKKTYAVSKDHSVGKGVVMKQWADFVISYGLYPFIEPVADTLGAELGIQF